MANNTKINGTMPVTIFGIRSLVYGGPYLGKPDNMVGVLMAEEINAKCTISVPTQDFSTPDPEILRMGIIEAVEEILKGNTLFVGCMGGIGRTGLFMAALAKLQGEKDPVAYVRKHYLSYAVETEKQQSYIKDLDLSSLKYKLLWLRVKYFFKNLLSFLD